MYKQKMLTGRHPLLRNRKILQWNQKSSELPAPNYGLLAFEWVENHAVELNERCNEYIAQKQDFLLLTPSELPERDSWLDICQELSRNGMENCECTEEGIQINLTQGSCRKE